MAAYVIADVKVTNPDIFREYMNQVPSTVERYGGKYLVRGGSLEQFEGGWEPSRLVIIEFENMDNAKNWYSSREYEGPIKLRHKSAETNVVFVEGI